MKQQNEMNSGTESANKNEKMRTQTNQQPSQSTSQDLSQNSNQGRTGTQPPEKGQGSDFLADESETENDQESSTDIQKNQSF